MRTIVIYGSSDDLFEVETDSRPGEPDEIACDNTPAAVKITANGEMGGGVDGLIVCGQYGAGAGPGWVIGIAPLENPNLGDGAEGLPIPPWPMVWSLAKNTYSPTLTIMNVPDNAKIEQILPTVDSNDD